MLDNSNIVDTETSNSIFAHKLSMLDNNFSSSIKWDEKHLPLIDVEKYIKEKEINFKLDYDITAIEPLNFKTINYTTFAGFLILHPLNFEQALRQMSDAFADQIQGNHINFLKNRIDLDKNFSKYNIKNKEKVEGKKVLVVLTGGNKLKKHCCVGKLENILNKYGRDNVLFKKHPVSHNEVYEELDEYLGGINYAPANSDLFELMKDAETVYSTMCSESALIASILGKKIGHFDLFQNRNTTSFGHINYYIYTTSKPLEWAQTTFASPKSGVIHPLVDIHWKEKVDAYFDYIENLWSFYDGAYC